MKRTAAYIGWFFVFLLVAMIIDSLVFPISADHAGYANDFEASKAIGEKHAPYMFIAALVLTIIGMRTGKLPGARRKDLSGSAEK